MSCFACCEEEDTYRPSGGGGAYSANHSSGNDGAYHASVPAPKGGPPVKVQPIAVPTIPVDELKEVTDNFGTKALIGEGSYGRVYKGILKNGRTAAIKKLDASKQPDQEFLAQVSRLPSPPSATDVASTMAFRSQEIYKKIARKMGEKLSPDVMESMKKLLPNSKIVMSRAKRGIFAGRHIQFGNKISEDGGNKSRRSWKPNVQEKRLFSYIHDRHIRVKVTTHALRCIDKAGGIDEYLLKTPYRKMDTELGLLWKVKTEKMYAELGGTGVAFFSPEDEAKIAKAFDEEAAAKKEARRVARRAMAKQKCVEEGRTWVENVEEENETEEATGENVKEGKHEATNRG